MDRFFQILIAMSGLAITSILGWFGYQADVQAHEAERQRTRAAYMELFSDQASLAISECNRGLMPIVERAVDELEAIEREEPGFWERRQAEIEGTLDLCSLEETQQVAIRQEITDELFGDTRSLTPSAPEPSVPITDSGTPPPAPPPVIAQLPADPYSESSALRSKEKTKGGGSTSASGTPEFHAVLASYRVGEREATALRRVAKLREQLSAIDAPVDFEIKVYRTTKSNHYALTLIRPGEALTDQNARENVRLARGQGLADDAFVQEDLNWIPCDDISSETALANSCGDG